MATNWIHCNKCALIFDKTVPFYVGACGHLECQKCLKSRDDLDTLDVTCSVCNRNCKWLLLSKDMQSDILMFFKPFGAMLDQTKKVYEFQEKQHMNLINLLFKKYSYTKKELLKSQKIIESQEKDIVKLKSILKSVGSIERGDANLVPSSTRGSFMTSTPMSRASHGLDVSMSTIRSAFQTSSRGNWPGSAVRMSARTSKPNPNFMVLNTPTPPAQMVPGSTSSVNSSHLRRTPKFGMDLPRVHSSRRN